VLLILLSSHALYARSTQIMFVGLYADFMLLYCNIAARLLKSCNLFNISLVCDSKEYVLISACVDEVLFSSIRNKKEISLEAF
jgi:hypothetical protein